MSSAIDHTQLPFDELIEERLFPRDLPRKGRVVCRIMQDGWEMGTWLEADWEGAGPIARKILAVNDLLGACQAVVQRWEHGDLAEAARMCAAAIAKALGREE
ncbi:MAG: hypothetical protein ABSF26_09795 [Thermoguttaceae bacterium]|jgi:hypothetical protein